MVNRLFDTECKNVPEGCGMGEDSECAIAVALNPVTSLAWHCAQG
jgi:hypothetical protein